VRKGLSLLMLSYQNLSTSHTNEQLPLIILTGKIGFWPCETRWHLWKVTRLGLLTPLPHGCKTITGRWLFTIKNGVDGQPERYKARFVARGFLQREGIDYDFTFAPVTSKTTLRVFLAGMVHFKMFPH